MGKEPVDPWKKVLSPLIRNVARVSNTVNWLPNLYAAVEYIARKQREKEDD